MTAQFEYSVVMAVKNGEKYLSTALDSIFSQTLQPLEVTVVNDSSTDSTLTIAQKYPVTIINNLGSGQAAALNTGIARCTGNLIAFLDHDDSWHPTKQAKQIEEFKGNKELDYVTCEVVNFDGAEKKLNMGSSRVLGATTLKADFIKVMGLFDENFLHHAIIEWWGRPAAKNALSAIVNEGLFFRLIHDSNSTVIGKDDARSFLLAAIRASRSAK